MSPLKKKPTMATRWTTKGPCPRPAPIGTSDVDPPAIVRGNNNDPSPTSTLDNDGRRTMMLYYFHRLSGRSAAASDNDDDARTLRSDVSDVERERQLINAGIWAFIESHPFPSEEDVINKVLGANNPFRKALNYDLAKRLWEAGGKPSEEERRNEILSIGLLLGSYESMHFHNSLIDNMISAEGEDAIFQEERDRWGLPRAPVNEYKNIIDRAWDGINSWQY